MIGGDCVDVTVRDLYLDGAASTLSDLDTGQHTHTIQVGGMNTGGSAHRVRILDCTMTDMDGDGVALAALAGAFGAGDEVSVVDIIGCKFLDCRRSGISNQRSGEFVRIHNCLFEGTTDQDIDFEPTGAELASGPRRYSIMENTVIHSSAAAAITLSGVSGDIPAKDNIFAYNHIYGGRVGMVDTQHVQIIGNDIESGLNDPRAVLTLRGTTDGAYIAHNQLIRVAGGSPGATLDISSRAVILAVKAFDQASNALTIKSHGRDTGAGPLHLRTSGTLPNGLDTSTLYWLIRIDHDTLSLATSRHNAVSGVALPFSDNGTGEHNLMIVDYPRGVDVSQNRIQSHTNAGSDDCTVVMTNGQRCAFTANDVSSYSGGAVTDAIRFVTSAAMSTAVEGWDISGNRILGDAGDGGSYLNGISVSPVGVAVSGVTVSNNTFRGCDRKIRWNLGGGGSYADTPTAQGNAGSGVDFADLSNVSAVCIGGNSGSQADYVYDDDADPAFGAADGSTARRRTGGGPGSTIYFREAGAWVGK